MVVRQKNESGKLVVNTKISDKGFKQDYKKLDKDTQKLLNQYNKQVGSIKKQEVALDKVKSKLNNIVSGNKTPVSIKNMETELKKANKETENLEKKYENLISQMENKKTDLEFAINLGNKENIPKIKNDISVLDNESIKIATELENANDKATKLDETIKHLKSNLNETSEVKELNKQIIDINTELNISTNNANSLKNKLKEAISFKFSNMFGGSGIQESIEKMGKGIDKFKQKMFRLVGTVAIFSLIRKGLTSLVSGFGNLLKSNDVFSNSLNQIKANLMTAFSPIYEYVLPAINSLMSTLAKVTGSIATFIAGLFGKTASQAKDNAKALQDQTKAQKELNDEQNQLASFDKLEVAGGNSQKDDGIDFSNNIETDDGTLGFLNKIKDILTSFDTSNLQRSISNLWESFKPFAENVGKGLEWLFYNVLIPLGQWTINELLPAFFNILAGALDVVNQAIIDLQPIFSWFWDNILQPIASWTGGIIVDILNGIGDGLKWISQNEVAMAIIEGVAIAIGLVAGALTLYSTAITIAGVVTKIFGEIIEFATKKSSLITLAIGLLIAIIILCIKHWDEIKETAIKVWNSIKEAWEKASTWFNEKIVQPIARSFSNLWDNLIYGAKIAWWGIQTGVISMANFVIDVINRMIKGVLAPFNTLIDGLNLIPGVNIRKLAFKIDKIDLPPMPKLATGAVIPPGQEFMAILGDQKHGKNLEAPESLIRKIVREESGTKNKEVILNAYFDIKIGDEKIDTVVLKGIRLAEKKLGKKFLVN